MKLTYRTPEHDYDHEETLDSEATESIPESEVASQPRKQWDDDCPWAEWYSAEDPVKGNCSLRSFTRNVVNNNYFQEKITGTTNLTMDVFIRIISTITSKHGTRSNVHIIWYEKSFSYHKNMDYNSIHIHNFFLSC